MRIPSGKTDQSIYFVAFATADGSRLTGLSGFTVYRSRNGAAEVAYTTPTISEIDATNMPGVYALLIDEDTTIASTSDSEEYCVHISVATMEPVTRTIELYRRDTTSGQTIDVTSGGVEVATFQAGAITAAAIATGAIDADAIATDAVTEIQNGLATAAALATVDSNVDAILVDTAEIGAAGAGLTALASAANLSIVAGYLDTEIAAIKAKTDNLPASPAATGDIPTAAQNATELLDQAAGVETGLTVRQWLRLGASALFGKASGLATTTAVYRDFGDTKDRITATVDVDGNRTAITRDAT